MTAAEIANHKEKVKKVMVEHLASLGGHTNLTKEQVMGELKNMWIKLEEAGLVINGMNFQSYHAMAQQAFMLSQIHDIMGI